MKPLDPVFITVTVSKKKEALRIADGLLDSGIIACAVLLPVTSLYLWKGKKVKGKECLLVLKTVYKRWKRVESTIRTLSSYECHSIEMVPINAMNTQALQWLRGAVR